MDVQKPIKIGFRYVAEIKHYSKQLCEVLILFFE